MSRKARKEYIFRNAAEIALNCTKKRVCRLRTHPSAFNAFFSTRLIFRFRLMYAAERKLYFQKNPAVRMKAQPSGFLLYFFTKNKVVPLLSVNESFLSWSLNSRSMAVLVKGSM